MAKSLPARPRPVSAFTSQSGWIGVAGLAAALLLLKPLGVRPDAAPFFCMAACALPMALWELLVDRSWRHPDTGLDWSRARPAGESLRHTAVKAVGLSATLLGVFAFYWLFRYYDDTAFIPYFSALLWAARNAWWLAPLAVAYIFWIDRHAADPRDGLWHTGRMVLGRRDLADPAAVADHVRGWAVKAFYLAFMASIYGGSLATFDHLPPLAQGFDPRTFVPWSLSALFFFDVTFGTIGYILTFRCLNAHLRSANPHFSAWVAALSCYPPFLFMSSGGLLNYQYRGGGWLDFTAGHPLLFACWAAALLALAFVYVWATVSFGLRFSNLTHRGIVTHGPYAWFKHPAYLSKNLYWWLVSVPFLPVAGPAEAVRNCLLLLVINGIYLARAKTEERHLRADPAYRTYAAWIERHGALARARAAARRLPSGRRSASGMEKEEDIRRGASEGRVADAAGVADDAAIAGDR